MFGFLTFKGRAQKHAPALLGDPPPEQVWHEELMRLPPRLQEQMLQNLQHSDPFTDDSLHQVAWQFSPALKTPERPLPPPGFWTHQPRAVDQPQFDLRPSSHDRTDAGFAPTVPVDLR